jgi:hypothetical protein
MSSAAPAASWQALGTDEVTLPTGACVRLLLPGPGALARHGVTPQTLATWAEGLTGQLRHGGLSEEEWQRWEGAIRLLICDAVLKLRLPSGEFEEPGKFLGRDGGPLIVEDFIERRIPPIDVDALTQLVLRLEAPARIDLASRVALGGMPVAEVARAWVRTEHMALPGWMGFMKSDEGLRCAISARTWGTRPSTLLGIPDPVVAYAVDEALAMRLATLGMKRRPALPEDVPAYDPAIARESEESHLAQLRAEGRLH